MAWPVLFLYPEHGETDFIEEFMEDDAFADHLNAMFGPESPPAPWDLDSKYRFVYKSNGRGAEKKILERSSE